MDPQVRNFRDFLLLYNKLTEMCFQHCTDNFYNRSLSQEETKCVDKCVQKFSNVNQKIMTIYVDAQSTVNQRRAAELEEQMKQIEQSQQNVQSQPIAGESINENSSSTTTNSSVTVT